MGTCLQCGRRARVFTAYLVVRERYRLSGWKSKLCERCLAPWQNGEPMGGIAVMTQRPLPADAGPPEAVG